jgi:hypothetical protein
MLPGTPALAQIAPVEELDSYRLRGKMVMSGGMAGSQAVTMSFTQEWVRASQAQHTITSVDGVPSSGSGTQIPASALSMEMIVIGKTAWMKSDKGWTRFDFNRAVAQQNNLTSPVGDWQNLKLVGEETINGIPCKHYLVDEDVLKTSAFGGQGQGDQSLKVRASGDLWVVNRADLPAFTLRMKIHMQVSGSFFSPATVTPDPATKPGEVPAVVPGSDGMSYDYEIDVTDINTKIVIEAPQSSDPNG